ncbi:MAG: hypothetical protein AAGI63_09155 [Planctomycetota bacterium]
MARSTMEHTLGDSGYGQRSPITSDSKSSIMRFELHHLLAVVTVAAVLLGLAVSSGYTERDGVWEVVSIDTVDLPHESYDDLFPARVGYVGLLRDGDREVRMLLGDSWDPKMKTLPKTGEFVELTYVVPYAEYYGYPGYDDGDWIASRPPTMNPWFTSLAGALLISLAVVVFSVVIQNILVRLAIAWAGRRTSECT